jgi:hypothetical protein
MSAANGTIRAVQLSGPAALERPGPGNEGVASMHDVPYGYCHCGCGRKAPLAPQNRKKLGHVIGQPLLYVRGHNRAGRGPGRPPEARFWQNVDKDAPNGCWQWKGGVTSRGYGEIKVPKRTPVHRYAYELLVGPIPDGLHLDHLCRNTACVNPDHLEPVTCRENVLRGLRGLRETQCRHGHELTRDTVYYNRETNRLACLTCKRAEEGATDGCGH